MAIVDLHLPAVGPLPAQNGAPAAGVATWRRWSQLSLAGQFLVASLVVLTLGMLIIGTWVSQAIERGVLNRSAALTALYVDSVLADHLQTLATNSHLDASDMATFDHLLADTPLGRRIVAFKVWSPSGEVLYSPDRRLVGQNFEVDGGLEHALQGEVSAELSDLHEPENLYERERWSQLLEVYAPVHQARAEEHILAGLEFYQLPEELEAEMTLARRESWGVVALVTLVIYLLLAGIVRRGSETIAKQRSVLAEQGIALRQQVAELSDLLAQNARLQQRLRLAAGRTTALNEQALRRIGADLHDGPGQALALALLRLEGLSGHGPQAKADFDVVRGAIQDAMNDIRAISSGLRLPQLAELRPAEVVERAVHAHERRSGTPVALRTHELPNEAPLPVKIALFRALEEALSNATRHAGGAGIAVDVQPEAGGLLLAVSDCGPGFAPESVPADGHLGLANQRERAELLGGTFNVISALGHGTTLTLWLPLPVDAEPQAGDH